VKFHLCQHLDASPVAVITLLADGDFHTSMTGLTKIGAPELISRTVSGHVVTVQMRYQFIANLPAAVTAVVSPSKLTWIDETDYDLDAMRATTVMRPDHYEKRLSASFTQTFAPVGDGTDRAIDGDLKVRALLVAGQVERAIVSGLSEHLAEERALLDSAL